MAKLIEEIPAALHQFIIHLFVLWWQMFFNVKSNRLKKHPLNYDSVKLLHLTVLQRDSSVSVNYCAWYQLG